MPSNRLDLYFRQETADFIRETSDRFGKRPAAVVDDALEIWGSELVKLYKEQARAVERRRAQAKG